VIQKVLLEKLVTNYHLGNSHKNPPVRLLALQDLRANKVFRANLVLQVP